MSKIFVGLDIGTTSTKAAAFDEEGQLIAEELRDYPLEHPEVGAAVQDPEKVLSAAESALAELLQGLNEKPAGIGVSAAMHSVILLDDDQNAITPVITWADTRATAVLADFSPEDRKALLRRTGTPVHPMSPLVKLRWLNQDQPELMEKCKFVSDIKSFLVNRWTKAGLLLDTNLASATGLYGLKAEDWDPAALDLAGVSIEQLPKIVTPTHHLGWKKDVAQRLGTNNIPLVIGGSDGCLANLGSDLQRGEVALSVGTSGALRTTHQSPEIDPEAGLFNYHLLEEDYVVGGATNNGGKLLDWLFHFIRHDHEDIGQLLEAASEADCDGLTFRPYLNGERAPIYDPDATAAFDGMRGHHRPAQYARAVLEGLTDNLVKILRQLEKETGKADKIIASGGLTRSAFWVRLMEEKSGRPVEVAETAQASAYGAALMAKRSIALPTAPTG